jgi:hypothetical protein
MEAPSPPREPEPVSFDFLVGAIVGSGIFLFFGGPPARVLAKAVQQRLRR